MIWCIFFLLALAVVAAELVLLIIDYFSKKLFNHRRRAIYFLMGGGALTVALLCFPAYMHKFSSETYSIIKSSAFSIRDAVKVFAMDNISENISNSIATLVDADGGIYHRYAAAFGVYEFVVLAVQIVFPLLTFGFVVSFIKNLIPWVKYVFFHWRDRHIFSELNEKTITMAESVLSSRAEKESRPFMRWFFKPLIVFMGGEGTDGGDELLDKARAMGSVVFRSDIDNIRVKRPLKEKRTDSDKMTENKTDKEKPEKAKKPRRKVRITFYLTGEDETEKIRYATHIIKKWDYDEVSMYVFSYAMQVEMLRSSWNNKRMQIYRVNDVQSLIYHNLHIHGIRLFDKAHEQNGNTISAVIVGLGNYGVEMLKALVWYCQVPGFKVKITAFDGDEGVEERLKAQCPELIEKNRDTTEGEAHYDITVHGGVDANQYDFYEKLKAVSDATYIFVSLGKDQENIDVAAKIRSELRRLAPDKEPDIETVVYDSNIAREMSVTWQGDITVKSNPAGVKNFKNQAYNIHMIGDLESFYSVKTVTDSELIEAGKKVNSRWAQTAEDIAAEEKKFWKYNYHYRSSVAKAIHEALRVKLIDKGYIEPIKGVGKPWNELNDDEKLEIGMFEHVRWNAYMRSEGYRCAEKRDDLAKTHNKLVSVKELSDDDLRKDA